jgi:hypothetical protein
VAIALQPPVSRLKRKGTPKSYRRLLSLRRSYSGNNVPNGSLGMGREIPKEKKKGMGRNVSPKSRDPQDSFRGLVPWDAEEWCIYGFSVKYVDNSERCAQWPENCFDVPPRMSGSYSGAEASEHVKCRKMEKDVP